MVDEGGREAQKRPILARPEPVLAWMKRRAIIAVDEDATHDLSSVGGLDARLLEYLQDDADVAVLFSIQKAVWELSHGGMTPYHDICFSAPTGSGKTLAYALPIVNALAARRDRQRVGCIVVLPTRGLAVQVHSVFKPLGESVGLRTVLACGSSDCSTEAEELMGQPVDVAIFTPGRLVRHIEATHDFYVGKLGKGRIKILGCG
jgi:ATP-dependent RNA helicase DDX51/DBP6